MLGNSKHLPVQAVSVAQESRSSLAGWLWLKVTLKLSIQLSARAVVSSEGAFTSKLIHAALGKPQKIHFQSHSHVPFHRTASHYGSWLPQGDAKENKIQERVRE